MSQHQKSEVHSDALSGLDVMLAKQCFLSLCLSPEFGAPDGSLYAYLIPLCPQFCV